MGKEKGRKRDAGHSWRRRCMTLTDTYAGLVWQTRAEMFALGGFGISVSEFSATFLAKVLIRCLLGCCGEENTLLTPVSLHGPAPICFFRRLLPTLAPYKSSSPSATE